ncbi:MFS transporter [Vallicoccus soli]|uniref:MFS transporter n=1 Tax=Vallicoccus soli TaxID=2339232 RepID=A0A3A3Z429_9ACTN|nr:MFS transporter [Vallicoccus soli]RJK97713.1 MFS transporter [Vallicoccus soli]
MTRAPRRAGPLVALLAAHGTSLAGNVLTLVALPLHVLAETGSASLTGLTGVVATLPVVVGGALGGVLVDRYGYRRSSVAADLASGATIALVPLLAATTGLPLWGLLLLVLLSGLLDAPGETARAALLPEAARAAGVPLERAVGWMSAVERAARLVGAPAAGFLVLALGALPVLAVDAATFALAALLVGRWVPAALDRPRPDGPGAGYWAELGEGLRFLVREPVLRLVVLVVLVTNALDAASSSVLRPVWADARPDGAAALGLLVGTMGGGALVGSLLFGAVGHRLPRRATFVVAFALCGPPQLLVLASGWSLGPVLVVTALAGVAAGAINPVLSTVELERVPPGLRARVFGAVRAGCWAAMPLGALGAGVAVDLVGLRPVLLAGAAAYLLVVLAPLTGGAWRGMDRASLSAPQPPAAAPRA